MTYDELSAEQKSVLQTFTNDLRALSGETQRLFNKYVALQARKIGQIDAIMTALDTNEIIPNTSGLAGAEGLPADADMIAIYGDFENILTNHNVVAKQQRRARACGNTNV